MQQTAVGLAEESDLALAVWLHQLGHDDLAAQALARSRVKFKQDGVTRLRGELAWSSFAGLVHAYMARADDEALAHGEWLLRLYPDEVDKSYPQAKAIVADLDRRKKEGTFGKKPSDKWPDEFDQWDVKKKLAYLIQSLDEVDARQHVQPGNVPLVMDRRVKALIQLGDAAIPDLIDTIETDRRLTRSVHFWRNFGRHRSVLGAREAALTAVESILQIRVFQSVSTSDNFTSRSDEETKKVVAELRAYWKQFANLPIDERMMRVLQNFDNSSKDREDAATQLVGLNVNLGVVEKVQFDPITRLPKSPNPAVAKFNQPTVAEAILRSMDKELVEFVAADPPDPLDRTRRHFEDAYLPLLVRLGDRRIASVLASRSRKESHPRLRRKYAFVCDRLGDPAPLAEFAADFRDGKIILPQDLLPGSDENTQPGVTELDGIVNNLAAVRTPEGDQALMAITDPKHPAFAMASQRMLANYHSGFGDENGWLGAPFCLVLLRRTLDDTTPTGATLRVSDNGEQVNIDRAGGGGAYSMPTILADPKSRQAEVTERVCDVAAIKFSKALVGLPEYHPLLVDADERLKTLGTTFDRFQGNFRRPTATERPLFTNHVRETLFIPDVISLDQPATKLDLGSGKAIFELSGAGQLAKLKLPLSAVLKMDEKSKNPPRVLIVQAEKDAKGELIYGVIARRQLLTLAAQELVDVAPLQKPEVAPE